MRNSYTLFTTTIRYIKKKQTTFDDNGNQSTIATQKQLPTDTCREQAIITTDTCRQLDHHHRRQPTLLLMKSTARSLMVFRLSVDCSTVTQSRVSPNWNMNVTSGPSCSMATAVRVGH